MEKNSSYLYRLNDTPYIVDLVVRKINEIAPDKLYAHIFDANHRNTIKIVVGEPDALAITDHIFFTTLECVYSRMARWN